MFGGYELIRETGKATLGGLYLARRPDGSTVVIKTLALATEFEPRDQEEVRKRFFREAEAAARLQHPAIRKIIESGEDDGTAWVAMETCAARSTRWSTSTAAPPSRWASACCCRAHPAEPPRPCRPDRSSGQRSRR